MGMAYFLNLNMEFFLSNTCQLKIIKMQIRRNFFWFASHHPSDEDIYKMTGFVPHSSRPARLSGRQLLDFTMLWALILSQTVQSGEAEKNHVTCCLDIM